MKHFYAILIWGMALWALPLSAQNAPAVVVGAARIDTLLPLLAGKKVALVVNHSSTVGSTHLADTLLARGVQVKRIFAPEHGFRGDASAGEKIKDGLDAKTGLPVLSLYGKKRKPDADDLAGIDVVVFDIQDVGARFYTYISTLLYVLEACAEQGKKAVVLDRPNPNGHFVDGPVLTKGYESFIGIAPIPIAHGCTVGELARFFAGERHIQQAEKLDLAVVRCLNYTHQTYYELPVRPSPNLPNMRAILMYPWMCLFEGTKVSQGRGTETPFQIIGYPGFPEGDFRFTPRTTAAAKNPPHEGKNCRGYNFSQNSIDQLFKQGEIDLRWLLYCYYQSPKKDDFFNVSFFDKLAGGTKLREQIIAGRSAAEIKASWQPELDAFKVVRSRYLLYP